MRKISKKLSGAILLFVTIITAFWINPNTLTANASYREAVTNLAQTSMQQSSISFKWSPTPGAVKYGISISERSGNIEKDYSTSTCSQTVTGLNPNKQYEVRITPYSADNDYGIRGYDIMTTTSSEVENFELTNYWSHDNSALFSWKMNLDTASGYELTLYNGKGKKVKTEIVNTRLKSGVFIKPLKNNYYTVKIRAYTELNGQKYYSNYRTLNWLSEVNVKSVKSPPTN